MPRRRQRRAPMQQVAEGRISPDAGFQRRQESAPPGEGGKKSPSSVAGAAKKPETDHHHLGQWNQRFDGRGGLSGGARLRYQWLASQRRYDRATKSRMVDQRDSLAREIDEELRREQLLKLWERYG